MYKYPTFILLSLQMYNKVVYSLIERDDFMEKSDLRIIKTKKALYDALRNLMKTKTFEEIKVSDICEEALINRSTFYAHFDDKYSLLESMIDNLKQDLTKNLNNNKSYATTKEYYIEIIRLYLDNIEENKDTYLSIAINNRNSILVDIIYDVIDKDIVYKLNNDAFANNLKIPKDIISKFFLGAVVNVGIYWIYNMNKYSKEELLNYLIELIPDEVN